MRSAFAVLVTGLVISSCDGNTPSQLWGLEAASPRTTTSETIALKNLDSSVEVARRRLEKSPGVAEASALLEPLMTRATFYGTFDDWEEADAVSKELLRTAPTDAAALLLRARVLNTLHEFEAARALAAEAMGLVGQRGGMSAAELSLQARHIDATVRLAQGAPPAEVVAERRAMAAAVPSYQNITSLALALAQQGLFDEADAAFRDALAAYRDVSPFPFAWVAFQRGVMWSEQAGRPDLGRPLYEEALRRLPKYVLANVHLAELDAALGDVDAVVTRLEPLLATTKDPEPLVVLASVAASPAEARRYRIDANRAYRTLIARFPEAFLHHAPQGDAVAGSPTRALSR